DQRRNGNFLLELRHGVPFEMIEKCLIGGHVLCEAEKPALRHVRNALKRTQEVCIGVPEGGDPIQLPIRTRMTCTLVCTNNARSAKSASLETIVYRCERRMTRQVADSGKFDVEDVDRVVTQILK